MVPQRVRASEETHGVGFWNEQSGSLLVAAILRMFANVPLVAMVDVCMIAPGSEP